MNWTKSKTAAFQKALLTWYDQNKRDLPWRKDHDPYHVLVSELMLQQTQVQTVIPYYQRFLAQFPTASALALAPEAAVLKAWEGLGYYSRARNLQKAAKQLQADYAGRWPTGAAELQKLAGIGPYTAGAIASIAFNQVEPAIDGNAFRVFARLFCVPDDIAKPKTRLVFDKLIRQVISKTRPGDFNQAIMDLGSSYYSASDPDPAHSPVAEFDESYQTGRVLDFPVKSKKKRPKVIPYFALVIRSPQGLLMQQRPASGMLAGLWMFPMVAKEQVAGELLLQQLDELGQLAERQTDQRMMFADTGIKPVKHTFTHQQWQITLVSAETDAFDLAILPAHWVPTSQLQTLALPTVQKKLFKALDIEV